LSNYELFCESFASSSSNEVERVSVLVHVHDRENFLFVDSVRVGDAVAVELVFYIGYLFGKWQENTNMWNLLLQLLIPFTMIYTHQS